MCGCSERVQIRLFREETGEALDCTLLESLEKCGIEESETVFEES